MGAVLTYVFQERAARRAEAATLRRELRAERMSAYSVFLTTMAEYRRGQLDWWWRREEDSRGEAAFVARVESYRLRGLAQAAFSQVQVVAKDPGLLAAVREAWDLTHLIHRAEDRAELDMRADRVRDALERFTDLAASDVQAGYGVGDGRRRQRVPLRLPGWRARNPETGGSDTISPSFDRGW